MKLAHRASHYHVCRFSSPSRAVSIDPLRAHGSTDYRSLAVRSIETTLQARVEPDNHNNGKTDELYRQAGFVSGMLISLIVVSVFLAGSLGFGAWAFLSRQDYKNNSDKKALAAANERQKITEAADAVKYAEAAKSPFKTHKSPDQFGAVTLVYPKTWSAYVGQTGSESSVVNNYYHPDVVPSIEKDNAHALRIQVVEQAYDQVLKTYDGEVKSGKLVSSAYALPKVSTIVGTRLNGEVERGKRGSIVIVPIRNMTLKVWTVSPNYLADFNKIILPNLSFSP